MVKRHLRRKSRYYFWSYFSTFYSIYPFLEPKYLRLKMVRALGALISRRLILSIHAVKENWMISLQLKGNNDARQVTVSWFSKITWAAEQSINRYLLWCAQLPMVLMSISWQPPTLQCEQNYFSLLAQRSRRCHKWKWVSISFEYFELYYGRFLGYFSISLRYPLPQISTNKWKY